MVPTSTLKIVLLVLLTFTPTSALSTPQKIVRLHLSHRAASAGFADMPPWTGRAMFGLQFQGVEVVDSEDQPVATFSDGTRRTLSVNELMDYVNPREETADVLSELRLLNDPNGLEGLALESDSIIILGTPWCKHCKPRARQLSDLLRELHRPLQVIYVNITIADPDDSPLITQLRKRGILKSKRFPAVIAYVRRSYLNERDTDSFLNEWTRP